MPVSRAIFPITFSRTTRDIWTLHQEASGPLELYPIALSEHGRRRGQDHDRNPDRSATAGPRTNAVSGTDRLSLCRRD